MTPGQLSACLRQGSGTSLARRRAVIGASLAAMGSLGVIALYQVGLIAHLPDPPLPGFDADKVHGSAAAYSLLAMPDAVLGLGSYAATAALAAMGGPDRATTMPWLPLALAGKAAFDVANAGRLTWQELRQQHALSAWSLLTVGATGLTGILAAPEAVAVARGFAHLESGPDAAIGGKGSGDGIRAIS